jgi:hypothetical protein
VHYHFVQNLTRLERLLQTGTSNGLIFTGDSSITLTGDSGVTVV